MSLYERASIIPGRSCTRSKSPDRLIKAWASHARGAEIVDTEDNRYIDMLCALGAVSLGYGTDNEYMPGVMSLPHIYEIEAGEAVLRQVAPWASSVRFFKTGSESTSAAVMVAKAATGRSRVVAGDWAYHGWHEWTGQIERFKYGFQALVEREDCAAVIVEPPRWPAPRPELDGQVGDFLALMKEICARTGTLLIVDEMIYGGRWALGGACEYYGIVPDMATFGKAIANGQSVACVVGGQALAEHGELASGTFSGDATGLGALLDTLDIYRREPVIDTLWERGRQLQAGLRRVVPPELAAVEGQPVHQRIRFLSETSAATYDYRTNGRPLAQAFREGMAERGVIMLPDAINVMYAHTPDQIDRVIEAVGETCRAIA